VCRVKSIIVVTNLYRYTHKALFHQILVTKLSPNLRAYEYIVDFYSNLINDLLIINGFNSFHVLTNVVYYCILR